MEITLTPRPSDSEYDVYLDGENVGHLIVSSQRLALFVANNGKSQCFTHAAELVRYFSGGKYGKT